MAGALKHKQRSHRSFYENRKVLGSVATAAAYRSNSRNMVRQAAGVNWLDRFKQMFIRKEISNNGKAGSYDNGKSAGSINCK